MTNTAHASATERTFTQYRIMSRKAGRRRFEFVPFTGASSGIRERITARLAELPTESPGWEFRLEERSVTVVEQPWEAAE